MKKRGEGEKGEKGEARGKQGERGRRGGDKRSWGEEGRGKALKGKSLVLWDTYRT